MLKLRVIKVVAEGCGFPLGKYHTPLNNSALSPVDTCIPFQRVGLIWTVECVIGEAVTVYAALEENGSVGLEATKEERKDRVLDFVLW